MNKSIFSKNKPTYANMYLKISQKQYTHIKLTSATI